jgi:hypothetical protein
MGKFEPLEEFPWVEAKMSDGIKPLKIVQQLTIK